MTAAEAKPERPALAREIAAVAGLVFSSFLALSLVSFFLYAGDPMPPSGMASPNWGGVVGHALALFLALGLGLSSVWVVILAFLFFLHLFSPAFQAKKLLPVVSGCSGIVLASAALMAAAGLPGREFYGSSYTHGGMAGEAILSFTTRFFGHPGAVLILAGFFLISLMGVLRFSVYAISLATAARIRQSRQIVVKLQEKRAERVARKVEKKVAAPASPPDQREPEVTLDPGCELPRMQEPRVDDSAGIAADDFSATFVTSSSGFVLPSLALMESTERQKVALSREHFLEVSRQLEEQLRNFGVEGKVEGISPGPLVTTYEFAPAPGVKINKIMSLADDLALVLKSESVRIVGSIPGKAALGIEIPNPERQTVHLREILASDVFRGAASRLTIALGLDVVGAPVCTDLSRMPHLLIAGATGSGKSVGINTILVSILYKSTPEQVRLLLVDPKRIELSAYEDIPHLLHPVVVEPKMASRALKWAVREMERRYMLMEESKVKSLATYNQAAAEKLPLILIVVDELADLMMVASRDVEEAIARLAQMARAAGIHLLLATQRPSVDVLTGLIKANFPTRISFKVSSKVDSRTILDTSGAEHLLGAGDMLFLAPGTSKLQRIHGAYISEAEITRVVDFLKAQGAASYDERVIAEVERVDDDPEAEGGEAEQDDRYADAVAIVRETGQASISMLQRRLRVGYNRAARMIEVMEREGLVGRADGARPRQVLARPEQD